MTKVTTWTHDKQLEMLQLINLSYEMTDVCLGGEKFKGRRRRPGPQGLTGGSFLFGEHLNNLDAMKEHDGYFHYTKHPKRLSNYLMRPDGPKDGICDPAGDPHPANVGKKRAEKGESVPDPLEGELRDYEWVGRFSDYGAVEGNVFRKNGTYYMVFDGSELRDWWSDWIKTDIGSILFKEPSLLEKTLEEAYRIYRRAKEEFQFNDSNFAEAKSSISPCKQRSDRE